MPANRVVIIVALLGICMLVYVLPLPLLGVYAFEAKINVVNLISLMVTTVIAIQIYYLQKNVTRKSHQCDVIVADLLELSKWYEEVYDRYRRLANTIVTLQEAKHAVDKIYRLDRFCSVRLDHIKTELAWASLSEAHKSDFEALEQCYLDFRTLLQTLILPGGTIVNATPSQESTLYSYYSSLSKALRKLVFELRSIS